MTQPRPWAVIRFTCANINVGQMNCAALSGRNIMLTFFPGRCPGLGAALALRAERKVLFDSSRCASMLRKVPEPPSQSELLGYIQTPGTPGPMLRCVPLRGEFNMVSYCPDSFDALNTGSSLKESRSEQTVRRDLRPEGPVQLSVRCGEQRPGTAGRPNTSP
jgi:hypothetical protein